MNSEYVTIWKEEAVVSCFKGLSSNSHGVSL